MSNIIAFIPRSAPARESVLTDLVQVVAERRRLTDDVFWLKENAELLNIFVATGAEIAPDVLATYAAFYDGIEEQLRFFPQYYRFFLSICLDLEALGFEGDKGTPLCNWAEQTGLPDAELSDLQRAEARRLLARRGAAAPVSEGDLGARLRSFVERPKTFALPNKKAAYELTHIVFYLSEYGTRDAGLGPAALQSLEFTGLVAYLDQNYDLLAEICTAIRYAGGTPSDIWTKAVAEAHAAITLVDPADGAVSQDAYHAYLVTGWAQSLAKRPAFGGAVPAGGVRFVDTMPRRSALRPLSECLFELGGARSGNWSGMRGRVVPYLDADARDILQQAEASCSGFEAFFEQFARATGS